MAGRGILHDGGVLRAMMPHRDFLLRVGLLPAVVLILLGALFFLGSTALRTQQEAMRAVVETDLESTAQLARINARLQIANADMYRLMTEAGAGNAREVSTRIEELSTRIDGIIAEFKAYRDSDAAVAQRPMLDDFIENLGLYKGAVEWVGSMLEIDFRSAVAFIAPYHAVIDRLSNQLSAIFADTTATAKARAAVSGQAMQKVAYSYVVAAAAVCILVAIFGYVMVVRQESLYFAARTKSEQVETLLNSSGQGFLSFGQGLIVGDSFSRACEDMLGRAPPGQPIDTLLFPLPGQEAARELMRSVMERVLGQSDPDRRAILLSLLPGEIEFQDKTLAAEYKPLDDGHVMLVLTDVTEQRKLAATVARERKRLEMTVAAVTDARDFFDAVEEFRAFARADASRLGALGLDSVYRQVHTFKGTFNQFAFDRLPAALHEVEDGLQQLRRAGEAPSAERLAEAINGAALLRHLDRDLAMLRSVMGDEFLLGKGVLAIPGSRVRAMKAAAAAMLSGALPPDNAEARRFLADVAALADISLKTTLAEYDRVLRQVAGRCDKEVAPLVVQGDEIMLDPETYGPFLRSLGHVFRNAVAHGIEDPDTRLRAGKGETGTVIARIATDGRGIAIEIADDGAGIALDRLRELAAERMGEAVATSLSDSDLLDLVFLDGLSTVGEATEASGRGVGLAAVRAAVEALGGRATVQSTPGQGTSFRFRLPAPERGRRSTVPQSQVTC